MKTYVGRGIVHAFLTSQQDGGQWSASQAISFTPGKGAPVTNWIRDWVGPRAGMDGVVKIKSPAPAGNQTLVVQLVP